MAFLLITPNGLKDIILFNENDSEYKPRIHSLKHHNNICDRDLFGRTDEVIRVFNIFKRCPRIMCEIVNHIEA